MTVHSIGKGLISLVFLAFLSACDNNNGDGTPTNPLILLNDAAVLEGDSGLTPLPFELQSPIAQSVAYRTFDITAAAGSDYVATSGQLDFAANEIKTLVVQVVGDTRVEATEVFGLEITYSDGTRSRFEGTIINDDFPVLTVDDRSIAEGDQGIRMLDFTLQLDQKTVDPFPVQVQTRDQPPAFGIATPGVDYEPLDEMVVIPAGATSLVVSVAIYGDLEIEPDETFILDVFNLEGDLLNSAVGEIRNDDIPGEGNIPAVTVADVALEEGDSGDITEFEFNVTLSFAATFDYLVQYEVTIEASDTATLGEDLLPQSGQIVFAPGETSKTITIEVLGDDDFEADETFSLVLTSSSGFEFDRATGTILNDDNPIVHVSDVSDNEGNDGDFPVFYFDVWLDEPPPVNVLLNFITEDGTAVSGTDYNFKSGTITFTPEMASTQIGVTVRGNNVYEPDKTFSLKVSKAGALLAEGQATILNDDLPAISVSVDQGKEKLEGGPGDVKDVKINVSLFSSAQDQLDYYYKTFDGTATGGAAPGEGIDFRHSEGLVRFPLGSTLPLEDVVVQIFGNARFEPDEHFYVRFFASEEDAQNNVNLIGEVDVIIVNDDFIELNLAPGTLSVLEGQPDENESVTIRPLSSMIDASELPFITVSGAIIDEPFDIHLSILDWLEADSNDISLDYNLSTLTIDAGDYYTTPVDILIDAIRIHSDTRLENDEDVLFGISANTFDQPAVQAGANTDLLITIVNDDVLRVRFDETNPPPDFENSPQHTPKIQAINEVASSYSPTGPGGEPLTVEINLGAGSTASNDDFDTMPLVVDLHTLSPGGITANETFDVIQVKDDDLIEGPEVAELVLTSTSILVEVDSDFYEASYEILSNNQLTLTFSESSYSFTEGLTPAAADRVQLCIVGGIVNAESPPLPLHISNSDVTATEGADYTLSLNDVFIPEGDYRNLSCGVIQFDDAQINIVDDGIVEADETFILELIEPVAPVSDYLTLGTPDSAIITIISNAVLSVEFTSALYEGFEGLADNLPQVRVIGQSAIEVNIPIGVADPGLVDYPAAEEDYTLGTLVIPAGHNATEDYSIALTINDNNDPQFNRIIPLELTPGADDPITLGAQTETLYRILDNDQEPMIHGTNSTHCANDDDGGIDCEDAVAPYLLQDALLNQEALSTSDRQEVTFNDDDWVCVTDTLTGLTWAYEETPSNRNLGLTEGLVDDSGGLCGLAEWRLPRLAELYNLLDFSAASPLVNTTAFDGFATTSSDYYWTDSFTSSDARYRFSFFDGDIKTSGPQNKVILVSAAQAKQLQENNNQEPYACASSGGTLPVEAVTDHRFIMGGLPNEETVTDNVTGLSWSARSLDTDDSADPLDINWGAALAMAESASYGGFDDWRMPTIKETLSLWYFGCDTLGGTRPDLGLTPHFLPLLEAGVPLPLLSSTVVHADLDDPLELWVLDLDNAELTISEPPSNLNRMQFFLVRQ